jgi:hypothetical protein
MAHHHSPKIVTDGLALALDAKNPKSFPGSGTTWSDLSGNQTNATLYNGTAWDSNGWFTVDGSNDYIQIPNVASLKPANELTVELVIKAVSIKSGWSRLYGQDPYTYGQLLFLETGGELIRALHFVGSTEYRCNTPIRISTSVFTHVIFTFKTGDAIRSYFNGVASTTTALPAGTFTYSGNPYLMGHTGASWPNIQYALVRSYTKALSPAEVQQNYQAHRSRFGI